MTSVYVIAFKLYYQITTIIIRRGLVQACRQIWQRQSWLCSWLGLWLGKEQGQFKVALADTVFVKKCKIFSSEEVNQCILVH